MLPQSLFPLDIETVSNHLWYLRQSVRVPSPDSNRIFPAMENDSVCAFLLQSRRVHLKPIAVLACQTPNIPRQKTTILADKPKSKL